MPPPPTSRSSAGCAASSWPTTSPTSPPRSSTPPMSCAATPTPTPGAGSHPTCSTSTSAAPGPQPRRRVRLRAAPRQSPRQVPLRRQLRPRAAGWVLDKECDLLRDLLDRYPDYTLTFTDHSLRAVIKNWLQKLSKLVTCQSSEFILFSAATAVRQHTCSASDF
ncbi:hypothetical protein ZWY2020_059759 [Hordeum vulgare]|nr:hypothetical protein ZWY2020_059759 [Hordeum vulgare]